MMSATYSPEDNKLRLYSSARLDKELYASVRAAGFIWAPKQDLFVAPAWTPNREDLLIELCGEIGDEDTTLVERAEERAERFEDYHEARTEDAERAQKAVHAIADNIPLGQPILVGHHSERHARKDAEKIENGMRKAVKMWDTAQYWKSRAAGAIRHAKYKELPAVRARRIKGLEADKRKEERDREKTAKCLKFWNGELDVIEKSTGNKIKCAVTYESALWFAGHFDSIYKCFSLAEYPRAEHIHQYEGAQSLWDALGGSKGRDHAFITVEQAREIALRVHTRTIENCDRWLTHLNNRLEYERAMLAESGGTATDRKDPEVGGGCRCWAAPRGGWAYIRKVNKVSVTIEDNWGNGGENFTRTIEFDKLAGIMTRAEVQAARAAGQLTESADKTGFFVTAPEPEETHHYASEKREEAPQIESMREQLRTGGVQVVSTNQLFPTPADLAARMVKLAEIEDSQKILEPSAGTGAILSVIAKEYGDKADITAIEINHSLASHLAKCYPWENFHIKNTDFITCNNDLGQFDRILMNPPFQNGDDIKHILHALTMLKPGGKLVAICANGPRQTEKLEPLADTWEPLPDDTFKEQGTGVRTVLLTINKPLEKQPKTQGALF